MVFKLFVFIICGIEILFLSQCGITNLALLNCIILCWLVKDIYTSITTYSSFDSHRCSYFQNYEEHTNHWYYPKKKQEDDLVKNIFKTIKPNMNIVLENDDKTKHMIESKQKNITEIIENYKKKIATESDTLEEETTTLEQTEDKSNYCDAYIIIENAQQISPNKTKVYDSILEFFKVTKVKYSTIKNVLENIVFIDLIEEIGNVVIYVKDSSIFKNNSINSVRLKNYIIAYSDCIKHVEIEQYKSLTIYEYFLNKNK